LRALNEFLNEHRKGQGQARKVEEQEATIRRLSFIAAEQQKVFTSCLKEQDSKIQAVNERLKGNNPHRNWWPTISKTARSNKRWARPSKCRPFPATHTSPITRGQWDSETGMHRRLAYEIRDAPGAFSDHWKLVHCELLVSLIVRNSLSSSRSGNVV